jgi:hypothetical protein
MSWQGRRPSGTGHTSQTQFRALPPFPWHSGRPAPALHEPRGSHGDDHPWPSDYRMGMTTSAVTLPPGTVVPSMPQLYGRTGHGRVGSGILHGARICALLSHSGHGRCDQSSAGDPAHASRRGVSWYGHFQGANPGWRVYRHGNDRLRPPDDRWPTVDVAESATGTRWRRRLELSPPTSAPTHPWQNKALHINALRHSSVADVTIILATAPFFTAGLGWLGLACTANAYRPPVCRPCCVRHSFGHSPRPWTVGGQMVTATENALINTLEAPLAVARVSVCFAEVPTAANIAGGMMVMAAVVGHNWYSDRWRLAVAAS